MKRARPKKAGYGNLVLGVLLVPPQMAAPPLPPASRL